MDVPARDPGEELLRAGSLEIRPAERLAVADGRPLTLSVREYAVLLALARHANHLLSREALFALAWGGEMRPGDRSVDVYVRKLRVKLAEALPGWRFIHTHIGFGYRFAAERSSVSAAGLSPVLHTDTTAP